MKLAKAPRTLTLLERKAYRNAYRGKVLLDERWIGYAPVGADPWPTRVFRDRLDLGKSCGCVLGHTMGSYWHALDELWPQLSRTSAVARSVHFGFNRGREAATLHRDMDESRHGQVTIRNLQRAWTYILRLLGR